MAGDCNRDIETGYQTIQRRGHRRRRPIRDEDQRKDPELAGIKQRGKSSGVTKQRASKPSGVSKQTIPKQREDMHTLPKRLEDVPRRLALKVMTRKREMEELEKEGRDSKESREARQRFNEVYTQITRELRNPRQVAEKLKRESKKRLRERSKKESTPEAPERTEEGYEIEKGNRGDHLENQQ
ncbi:uncharacterized protein BDW43DRAFT_315504 [Aspergillus alliaceus]|uniref:uncharacterized protein n=1 Tax=Petromyces alliaceus TaxID=209559 RepID=UPI0012A737B0|nr:uncharacterized protein BDW43DRAFT_315504 [Aspergillus alliaceus]KAB8228865.1 hypothetical protein BDW43DRAFT_315504 [Aspergillus alliaceus]